MGSCPLMPPEARSKHAFSHVLSAPACAVDRNLVTDCEALVLPCVIARATEIVPTISAAKRASVILVNIVESPAHDERGCSCAIEFALRGREVTFAQFTIPCSIPQQELDVMRRTAKPESMKRQRPALGRPRVGIRAGPARLPNYLPPLSDARADTAHPAESRPTLLHRIEAAVCAAVGIVCAISCRRRRCRERGHEYGG